MDCKSISQRFVAIAFIGATVATFFAPVEAPAQTKDLPPPGRCTNERHRELQDAMEAAWALVRKCSSPPDTIEIMSEKVQRFRDAIIAREKINNECFDGGDEKHKRQVASLEQGKTYCQERIAAKRKHQDRCPGK
jgi:Novel toxin 16